MFKLVLSNLLLINLNRLGLGSILRKLENPGKWRAARTFLFNSGHDPESAVETLVSLTKALYHRCRC